jgi:hypothetical protein
MRTFLLDVHTVNPLPLSDSFSDGLRQIDRTPETAVFFEPFVSGFF